MLETPAIERRHLLVFGIWIVFLLASLFVIRRLPSPKKKQRAGEILVWISGALLIALTVLMGNIPPEGLLVIAPAILFITWYNVRSLRICEKCSSFNSKNGIFRSDRCRQCGAPLENTPL